VRVDSSRAYGAIVLALVVAACGGAPPEETSEPSGHPPNQTAAPSQPGAPKIACAAPGSLEFALVCTLDRTETPDGVILTLRHPEGAFHRLQITRDGRGVIAADGAEPARVTLLGTNLIEVELGGARYRLPATVRGQAPQ
jgi:hypothetical protein